MSVKIEILDYKYGSGDNLVDVNQGSAGSGWTINSSTSASWDGSGAGITYLNNISSQSLVIGRTYNLSFKLTGKTGTSDMGFSASSGVPVTARSAVSGSFSFTFVATGTSFPDIYGRDTNTGTISHIVITDASVVDWDNSIVGELDVTDHSDFPLALTFQISDFKDLTATSGDYSKTFKIPATKNNNNLLKHIYIPNISNENQVIEKKSCRILFNNLYSLVGLIQVSGVGGYGETPSYYNCVFFGSNLGWASKISESYMDALEWGDDGEDLTYNKDSIVATWQDEDCNSSTSPIVYPITSYGDYNELGELRTIQLLDTAIDSGGGLGSSYYGFNDNTDPATRSFGTPPPVSDWRPSVFVKTTLDKIFSNIGYKISSAFMETDMFKKLVWLLPNFKYNNTDDRVIKYGYGNGFIGEGAIQSFTANATGAAGSYVYPQYNVDLNDAGVDFVLDDNRDNTGWNASNGVFTVQEYGVYTTQLNNMGLYWDNWIMGASNITIGFVKLTLQVKTVGQSSWNIISSVQTSLFTVSSYTAGTQAFPNLKIDRFLNKGDELRLRITIAIKANSGAGGSLDFHLFGSSTPTSATQSSHANAGYTIELKPENVEYGQTYNLTDVMNADYKQIDFIKGIAHAFNLKMTTNESTKTVNIEPFDTFYKPYGDAVDWTDKIDRSNDINDKWLESELKRNLVFKYKSDNEDVKVKERGDILFNEIQDEYPYREILPETFNKGESTFENPFFAGTYNTKDQDGAGGAGGTIRDTAYSACLWTEAANANNQDRPDKGYDFLPRLLYWNKYSPSVSGGNKYAVAETWASTYQGIFAYQNVAGVFISNIYPQATMVNRDNTLYIDSGGSEVGTYSPNLGYGNAWVRDFDDATGVYSEYIVGRGLYDTYYRNMIEGLKRSSRLRTVSVALKITDIINLDFTKLIYIDGTYWRINRIIDYKPNKNESTKVELIEWFQVGVFAATAPMFGSSGTTNNWDGSVDVDDNWGL